MASALTAGREGTGELLCITRHDIDHYGIWVLFSLCLVTASQ